MQPVSGIGELLASARSAPSAAARPGATDFTRLLGDALNQVESMQEKAGQLSQRFQLEDPGVSLEDTIIAIQKANIGFQAVVQTRNKLVSAYNEIMNMQI
jgi:flagellar hook-basal body complex protein FliE